MSLPSRVISFLVCMFFVASMSSCLSTQKAIYFENVEDTLINTLKDETESIIQKNDILSVYISSLNPEASAVFNAPNTQATSTSTTTGSTSAGGYLVNSDGNIQLPILGTVKAAGLTKKTIKTRYHQCHQR